MRYEPWWTGQDRKAQKRNKEEGLLYFDSVKFRMLKHGFLYQNWGFPGGTNGKESACQCKRLKRCRFDPWVGKISWRRAKQPTPVFLPRESHGQRSLASYSP